MFTWCILFPSRILSLFSSFPGPALCRMQVIKCLSKILAQLFAAVVMQSVVLSTALGRPAYKTRISSAFSAVSQHFFRQASSVFYQWKSSHCWTKTSPKILHSSTSLFEIVTQIEQLLKWKPHVRLFQVKTKDNYTFYES